MKRLVKINGKLRKVLTLGELATMVGKDKSTMFKHIERGILPEANFRMPEVELSNGEMRKGARIYTFDLCIKVKEVYSDITQGKKVTEKQKAELIKIFNGEAQT